MLFSKAGPAEILRASQKDELYEKKLQKMVLDIFLRLGGTRLYVKYMTLVDVVGYLFYYGNTTLAGLQTLGEEYTGIIQVDSSLRTVPSFLARLVMLLLDCSGSLASMQLLSTFEQKINDSTKLKPEARDVLLKFIRILRAIFPFISHFHKALFYCTWHTYHIAKRITGIHYILVRFWLKDKRSLPGFKLLGAVTLLHLLAVCLQSIYNWYNSRNYLESSESPTLEASEDDGEYGESRFKCTLCLDRILGISATPCGHLFCWSCIHRWLQSQDHCPNCREPLLPSRIVPIQNYG